MMQVAAVCCAVCVGATGIVAAVDHPHTHQEEFVFKPTRTISAQVTSSVGVSSTDVGKLYVVQGWPLPKPK
jgi:hypothetical protein